jgi:hypothetical protein
VRTPVLLLGLVLAVTAGAAPAAAQDGGAARDGIWISPEELQSLPTSGPAWSQLDGFADAPAGTADISDQDNEHDVHVLAAALVSARTGSDRLREKAAEGIMDVIGTEDGGRSLALARGLLPYVVAADLIDLEQLDPERDRRFREWLRGVRNEVLEPESRPTVVTTHERAANNWGTHAGASRIAAAIYLDDRKDLARAAAVFKGFLGDREAFKGFNYEDDLSWQSDPAKPVGVVPAGKSKGGERLDGALPEDMRRGCPFRPEPCPTRYPWEAMQGIAAQAELLSRQGYDAWGWEGEAVRRAAEYLFELNERSPNEDWAAPDGNQWIPWLLNARYGAGFPTQIPAQPGKGMGFADWTHATPCQGAACAAPRGEPKPVAPAATRPDPRAERRRAAREEDDEVPWPLIAAGSGALVLAAGALALGARSRRRRRVGGRG